MQLPVTRLDEPARDHYLEHGGIHGSELDGRKGTVAEYDRNVAFLFKQMEAVGTWGIGDKDYYIDRNAQADYFPWVGVANAKILTPALIHAACLAVAQMEPAYRVDVCNAWGYLDEFGRFNIFVEHDHIYVFAESDDVPKMLGLAGTLFEVQRPS